MSSAPDISVQTHIRPHPRTSVQTFVQAHRTLFLAAGHSTPERVRVGRPPHWRTSSESTCCSWEFPCRPAVGIR